MLAPSLRHTPPGWSRTAALALAVVVLAVMVVYARTLAGPLVLDDRPSITENGTIRKLWPLSAVLNPPGDAGQTVAGRPVVNLSLALNWAMSGERVESYHAVNVAIHIAAGLVLAGLVRRLLRRGTGRRAADAEWIAVAVAALWLLHPLQTEAVSYVVQRAESLMALFYLLTLYAVVRSAEPGASGRWQIVAVAACTLGMATKEVMVSAPLIALGLDAVFLAGSFRAAWAGRRWCYVGMAASWGLLAALVVGASGRSGSAGWNTTVSVSDYALTQCGAVGRYLRLALWPSGQVFDYGFATVKNVSDVAGSAVVLLALAGAAAWAVVRRPRLGWAAVFFFAVLAPSSSVVPVATQTMAEHRMYLPLAVVVGLAVVALHAWLGRRGLIVAAVGAVALGVATWQRNGVYRDEITLWSDTVAKAPENVRARTNLAKALDAAGRTDEAQAEYERATALGSEWPGVYFNYGLHLVKRRRMADAVVQLARVVAINPNLAEPQMNLGVVLAGLERNAEALPHLEAAVRLKPELADAQSSLGNALARERRFEEAAARFEEALRLRPDFPAAQYNYGNVLLEQERFAEAERHFARAVELNPDYAAAWCNRGLALAGLGRFDEAVAHVEQALRLQPGDGFAREVLGNLRAQRARSGK